jgi:hypothetical protein
MPKIDGDFPTLTIRRLWTAVRPGGRTALILETQENGPIAFEVHLEAIPALREQLDAIELALRSPAGRT